MKRSNFLKYLITFPFALPVIAGAKEKNATDSNAARTIGEEAEGEIKYCESFLKPLLEQAEEFHGYQINSIEYQFSSDSTRRLEWYKKMRDDES